VNELPGLTRSAVNAVRREDGQTMAEYGVVLGVITLAIITAIAALSGAIEGAYNAVAAIL
jgi:Flp pilus assembly pilin Flp